ncbi:FAD:protein FMN transferase [Pseudolysinimonas sp.]|uniref:FAD:protein FMN transferase n=1 Tax=Pseudolysinimonas sp. TaxID=2680009 RepID=UPI00286A617D|nr:FAD:protein FMN transferase [Pseudolysinimonas sp.]
MIVDPLPVAWRFEAIGTTWRIDTQDALPHAVARAVGERVERFDRDWSRFRPDSLVSQIATRAGRHVLPADAAPLLAFYRELYDATSGRLSPLVGRTLEALGYDAAYRLRAADDIPAVPPWDNAVAWDGKALETVRPVLLDVGAAGKGYLVDLVSDLLIDAGIPRHIVDASGDLRTRGVPMWIALEHPLDARKAVGVADLTDGAFCASATNRRTWGDGLHHVLDAATGLPVAGVIATWVIAPTTLVADGIATALFLDPDPELVAREGAAFARMWNDGRVDVSDHFPGEIFG